jgi:tetratricopeptide (TPR) repeat protein
MPQPRLKEIFDDARNALAAGEVRQAEQMLSQLQQLNPNHPELLNEIGILYAQYEQLQQAEPMFRRAIAIHPTYARAWNNLGNILQMSGRLSEAIAAFETALQHQPDDLDALANLGSALHQSRRPLDALDLLDRAISLHPNIADLHNNRGSALHDLYRLDESAAAYRKAIEIEPKFLHARKNLSIILLEQRKIDESLHALEETLQMDPEFAQAHYAIGTIHLLTGDFTRGWREYEWRRRDPNVAGFTQQFSQTLWDGSAFHGKRLLIHAEQGFGDTIQFARYLPLVAERGGEVIFQVQPELMTLLSRIPGPRKIVTRDEPLPGFDLHCPLLGVAQYFEEIPDCLDPSFLHSSSASDWAARMKPYSSVRKIGLAWAGRPTHARDWERSLRFEQIRPILDQPKASFFSLQIPFGTSKGADSRLVDWTEHLHGFASTAGLIAQMDLIITVDTAVAHLAGSMGRNVWVMLPHTPDWRWMLDRTDSPWYPTMRLFRQPSVGDWDSVITNVSTALRE